MSETAERRKFKTVVLFLVIVLLGSIAWFKYNNARRKIQLCTYDYPLRAITENILADMEKGDHETAKIKLKMFDTFVNENIPHDVGLNTIVFDIIDLKAQPENTQNNSDRPQAQPTKP